MVATILLLAVLGLIVMNKAVKAFSGAAKQMARVDGHWMEETVIENNHSRNKIAVIDVHGIIADTRDEWTGESLVGFLKDQFEQAAEDEHVKAVVLRIDSPGGEVLASDEIARFIQHFQDEHEKPVVVSMGSLAASGGYYISAPCRWIVANELTITGSIGVIMQNYNFRGLLNKVGVKPETFKSGKFKDMLSPDKEPAEITAEERAMIQSLIDETYAKFRSVVADGRQAAAKANKGKGRTLVSDWKDYADGRVFSGKQAYELGFADELGDFDTAVERALAIAGINEANLVQYRLPVSFANFLRIFGKSHAQGIKVDVGVDIPKITAGKMYFLSPTVLR